MATNEDRSRDVLEQISRLYSFVRSRSLIKTLTGFTFDDFLNQEKERIKGEKNPRMSVEKRLEKLNADIQSVESEAERLES